ncbi:MAG: hypothetical protein ACK4Y5_08685 [Acetobacteraceae bacterium]
MARRNPPCRKRGDGRALQAQRTSAVSVPDFALRASITGADSLANGFALLIARCWQRPDLRAPALLIFKQIENIFMMERTDTEQAEARNRRTPIARRDMKKNVADTNIFAHRIEGEHIEAAHGITPLLFNIYLWRLGAAAQEGEQTQK